MATDGRSLWYAPVETSCGVGACYSSGTTSCVGGDVVASVGTGVTHAARLTQMMITLDTRPAAAAPSGGKAPA